MTFLKRRLADLQTRVKSIPRLWLLARRLGYSTQGIVATPQADACIEGFQSSANSYVLNVVRYLTQDLTLAHHTHVAANVMIARRYDVPTVVLYRQPQHAIASLVSRFRPKLYEAATTYAAFYETILERHPDVLFVSFEEATSRTERMLDRITATTGIEFHSYHSFDDVDRAVKAEIRRWQQANKDPYTTPLPTEERESQKHQLKQQLLTLDEYDRARHVYERVKRADEG